MIDITSLKSAEENPTIGIIAKIGNVELNDMCKTLDELREVLRNHRSEDKSKAKIYASDALLERCAKILFAFVRNRHTVVSEFDNIDIRCALLPTC